MFYYSSNKVEFCPLTSLVNDMTKHIFFRQLGSCLGVYTVAMCFNAVITYSSILIPQMQLKTSKVVITTPLEISLVASMAALPMSFGTLLNGYLMERFGRKLSLLFSQIPMSGWLIIGFSENIYMVFIGRFLTGWSAGMSSILCSVYIAEIASTRNRAFLLALMNLSVNLGMLTSHILGFYIRWNYVAIIVFAFAVFGTFLIAFWSPETPFWLILNGRYSKCVKTLSWLSGVTEEVLINTPEFVALQKKAERLKSIQKDWKYYAYCFTCPEFYKPLLISIMFFLIAQFSGLSAITFYSVTIFQDILGSSFRQETALLIIDLLRVFWSLVSVLLMHVLQRRLLAIISTAGVSISLLFLSTHNMFCNFHDPKYHYLFPLTSICMYISFISIGLLPLPWCMIGELFSSDNKGFGASLSATVCFIAAFVVVKSLPFMLTQFGANNTFLIYGIVALFGTLYLFYFLPETRHKTFSEIEDGFRKKEREVENTEN